MAVTARTPKRHKADKAPKPHQAMAHGLGKHELNAGSDPSQSGLYMDPKHKPRMGHHFKMRRPSDSMDPDNDGDSIDADTDKDEM